MARIRELTPSKTDGAQPHPTEVDCTWQVVAEGGETLLQLSTYGSDKRQSQPKVSQTIQIGPEIARQLRDLLDEVFPA